MVVNCKFITDDSEDLFNEESFDNDSDITGYNSDIVSNPHALVQPKLRSLLSKTRQNASNADTNNAK